MIHWLVLTGGASSRFGRNKALAVLGDRSLTDRAVGAIRAGDPGWALTTVGPDRSGGPAAAVVSMLPEVDQEYVGVLAVDMPFASDAVSEVVETCRRQAGDARVQAWVPIDSDGRRQWLCAIYRRDALARAAVAVDDWVDASFHRLVGDLVTCEVPLRSNVSLIDVDTPEDFDRALRIVEGITGESQT